MFVTLVNSRGIHVENQKTHHEYPPYIMVRVIEYKLNEVKFNLSSTVTLSTVQFIYFISAMTVCNLKGAALREPTNNSHPTHHFPSDAQSVLAFFSSLFWFSSWQCHFQPLQVDV